MSRQNAALLVMHTAIAHAAYRPAPARARVDETYGSLFDTWWMADEVNTTGGQPGFFFACGQVGGTGTSQWNQCVCDAPNACANCYRWWDAIAIESVANRGIYLGDEQHADAARTLLAHSPYSDAWAGKCPFMDDFAWYLLAYTRVFVWLKEPAFLHAAERLHTWLMRKGHDRQCGGVTWRACGPADDCGCDKNSVTLLELLIGSARLALLRPAVPHYLATAKDLWSWFHTYEPFDADGLVYDGLTPTDPGVTTGCCNATHAPTCTPNYLPGYSYNQARPCTRHQPN
jgi:hypothetical protein